MRRPPDPLALLLAGVLLPLYAAVLAPLALVLFTATRLARLRRV